MKLSGVNSINWARIMAQVVYYFVAAAALGSPDRAFRFVVPTGNFGDIFAGYVAKRMGLPIAELVIATNENDILARTLETGRYEVTGVVPTMSPSMDIQVSSNFERLLFDSMGRDAAGLRNAMASLSQSGSFTIEAKALAAIRSEFSAYRASEDEVASTIKTTFDAGGPLLDPHTAVGVVAARKKPSKAPTIILATAHAAKFPDAVEKVSGTRPPLPLWLGDLMQEREHITRLPNDQATLETQIILNSGAA